MQFHHGQHFWRIIARVSFLSHFMQSLCIFPRFKEFKLTPLLAKNYKDRSVSRSRRDHRREACLDYIRRLKLPTNTTPALEAASGSHEPSPLPSEAHTSSEAKRRSTTIPNKLTPGKFPSTTLYQH